MRVYYKNSLFLYEIQDRKPTPIIIFWRATVFTFNKKASKRSMKKMINELVKGDLIEQNEKNQLSFEARQVSADESKGLGFYFVDLAKGERKGWDLHPEDTVAVWNLPAYEKINVRLGQSDFNRQISYYRAAKNVMLRLGREPKSFWEWFAR